MDNYFRHRHLEVLANWHAGVAMRKACLRKRNINVVYKGIVEI